MSENELDKIAISRHGPLSGLNIINIVSNFIPITVICSRQGQLMSMQKKTAV